jgi:hypothetical protein
LPTDAFGISGAILDYGLAKIAVSADGMQEVIGKNFNAMVDSPPSRYALRWTTFAPGGSLVYQP